LKRDISDGARNLACSFVFLPSHQKTIFSLACAAYPGVLGVLHSAIGMVQNVCWGKCLLGDVLKCSDLHGLKMEGSLGMLLKCGVDML